MAGTSLKSWYAVASETVHLRVTALVFFFVTFAGGSFATLLVSRGTQGVDRYTDTGAFLGQITAPGSGGLTDARGIAVAPNGDILVADWNLGQILRYNSSGA